MTSEAQALAPGPCLGQGISIFCQGVWVTLCFAFQKLVAVLSSEALKLCTCPVRGPFLLHSPLPGAQVLSPLLSLSLFFSFILTDYVEVFLPFQKSEVFCQYSLDVLCKPLWTYLREEVGSMSYSSAILIPPSRKA